MDGNQLLLFYKIGLAGAADRALPVLGQILEGSIRRDSVVRVALLGIVNMAAYTAFVRLHDGESNTRPYWHPVVDGREA